MSRREPCRDPPSQIVAQVAVGGEAGAAKAITVLRKELDNTMVYCGTKTVEEITPDILFGPRFNTAAALVS